MWGFNGKTFASAVVHVHLTSANSKVYGADPLRKLYRDALHNHKIPFTERFTIHIFI